MSLNKFIRNRLLSHLSSLPEHILRQTTRKQCRKLLEKLLNQSLVEYKPVIKQILVEYALKKKKEKLSSVAVGKKRKLNELKLETNVKKESKDNKVNNIGIPLTKKCKISLININKQQTVNIALDSISNIQNQRPENISAIMARDEFSKQIVDISCIIEHRTLSKAKRDRMLSLKDSHCMSKTIYNSNDIKSEVNDCFMMRDVCDVKQCTDLLIAENGMCDLNVQLQNKNQKKSNANKYFGLFVNAEEFSLYSDINSVEEIKWQLEIKRNECRDWKQKAQKLAKILKPKEIEFQKLRKTNLIFNQNMNILHERYAKEMSEIKKRNRIQIENVKNARSKLLRTERYAERLKKKYDYVCNRFNIDQNMIIAEIPE